jgi:hypothetical protein
MIALALIVRSSDPTGLLFWCVVGFCAGIGLFIYGFRLILHRRLILDTPFSKIRSAPMGMVEISGLAVGPYTMVAPITARSCYYYRTLVWEWRSSGKNSKWVKVAGECMHVPFFVDDNTGRVLVDPRGADLDLHRDFQQEFCNSFFTTKDPAPPNVTAFLARHGVATSNKIKVEEYCIKPKNALFILGTLAENPGLEVTAQPIEDHEAVSTIRSGGFSISINSVSLTTDLFRRDSDAAFEQRFADRFNALQPQGIGSPQAAASRAANQPQEQKIADALLKAGVSNPAAWRAAGVTATGVQLTPEPRCAGVPAGGASDASAADTNGFELHPQVVLMKGANNNTFLISWRSQKEVARSLEWKSALMIWGGPALALISLYFFLGIEKLL